MADADQLAEQQLELAFGRVEPVQQVEHPLDLELLADRLIRELGAVADASAYDRPEVLLLDRLVPGCADDEPLDRGAARIVTVSRDRAHRAGRKLGQEPADLVVVAPQQLDRVRSRVVCLHHRASSLQIRLRKDPSRTSRQHSGQTGSPGSIDPSRAAGGAAFRPPGGYAAAAVALS
jgi:hypothetical protein